MKTQTPLSFKHSGKTQLENLVKEVKETIAANAPVINQKTAFGKADLWNLERNRRNRVSRRYLAF